MVSSSYECFFTLTESKVPNVFLTSSLFLSFRTLVEDGGVVI